MGCRPDRESAHARREGARRAPSPVRLRAVRKIEHGAIGAVADGMRAGLKPRPHGSRRRGGEPVAWRHREPARPGLVGVVLEQHRAPRAKRAIGVQFDRPHRHPMLGIDQGAAREPFRCCRRAGVDHHVEAGGETSLAAQPAVGLDGAARRPRVVHHRQAQSPRLAIGDKDLLVDLARSRRRNMPFDQPLRGVDEHAGGRSGRITQHASPLGVFGACVDACQRQRLAVGPQRVSVDAFQHHRGLGSDGVKVLPCGPVFHRPVVLVPAAAHNPSAGRQAGRACRDFRRDARQARGIA